MCNKIMKNKLIIFGLIAIAGTANSAVEVDLRKGVDLTATNYVSFSLLNQLVDNGTIWNSGSVTNGRGIVMRSTIRPHVTHNPRYTNWLWLDLSLGSPGTLRQYVCCGDADANWQVAALGIGSVTSTNILDYTIQAIDMATNSVPNYALQDNSVDANKIQAQAVVAGKVGPSAVSNLNIAPSTIEGGRIALNTISNANMYDFTLLSNKIAVGGIAAFNLAPGIINSNSIGIQSIAGTNIQNGAITNEQLAASAVSSNKIAAGSINLSNIDTNFGFGIVRCWGLITNSSGGSATLLKGLAVTSVTRISAGRVLVTFDLSRFAPATTRYAVFSTGGMDVDNTDVCAISNKTVTTMELRTIDIGGGLCDDYEISFSILDF